MWQPKSSIKEFWKMADQESVSGQVWVFNGNHNYFPSAVFTQKRLAEDWIRTNQLEGTLTAYPLNISVYDWPIQKGFFSPKKEQHTSPVFVANFSSASQEHDHFENGEL